ncbi:LysR family transcriptional regulator [Pseudaminobacter salicylatoxidans]|uniref:LysR family transcriptional regulator n=1 Tax=Pseudaminobacter salicylatoxidans TaxID=93369 RepID=UPI0002E223FA|nr:LysR family transcriptional regulator [Pseudaminobacter salicylatoxidans]
MIRPEAIRDLNHVNLKLINTFVCVADFGSFHAAAKALGRSQSAISMQIRELEAQAGVQLFLRTTRHLELTAAGKMLLDQARTSISSLSMTFRHIQEDIDFRRGHVRIACSPTYAAARLPYIIKTFKDAFPGVKVSIGEYKSAEILNALKQDKADFGVGPALSDPGMVFEYGRAEPLLAVVPEEWVESEGYAGTISLDAVLSHPLVMFYPNTVVHQIISSAAEERGLSFAVEYSCIQGETLLAFANAGIGIAVLTASIANLSNVRDCKVLRIIEPELHRHFTMITRKGIILPPAAKHLYGLIAQDITSQSGRPYEP